MKLIVGYLDYEPERIHKFFEIIYGLDTSKDRENESLNIDSGELWLGYSDCFNYELQLELL